jgi:hypothetical protein
MEQTPIGDGADMTDTEDDLIDDSQVLTLGLARSLARQCLDAVRVGKQPHEIEVERLCCFILALTEPL